jgi:hypothetical protein
MNTTRLVPEVSDYGDTPEVYVTGYASVSRISTGIIRETYYVEVELADGMIDRRVVMRLLWDAEQWFAARRRDAAADLRHLMEPKPPRSEATAH